MCCAYRKVVTGSGPALIREYALFGDIMQDYGVWFTVYMVYNSSTVGYRYTISVQNSLALISSRNILTEGKTSLCYSIQCSSPVAASTSAVHATCSYCSVCKQLNNTLEYLCQLCVDNPDLSWRCSLPLCKYRLYHGVEVSKGFTHRGPKVLRSSFASQTLDPTRKKGLVDFT